MDEVPMVSSSRSSIAVILSVRPAIPAAQRIPPIKTPEYHLAELRNTQGRLGWKIDTRAAGGYVLAAGSTTATGTYAVLDDRTPMPLPRWLTARLTPPPTRPATTPRLMVSGTRAAAYIAAAIEGETQRVRTAPRGRHNITLYLAAIALGQLVAGGALAETTARAALAQAAVGHVASPCKCTTPDIEATIVSGLRAGAKRPRIVAA